MTASTKDWLTRKEAAAHLTALGYLINPRTLARMATDGDGPPYRRIMYRITSYNRLALEKWVRENTVECNQPAPPKIQTGGALASLRR